MSDLILISGASSLEANTTNLGNMESILRANWCTFWLTQISLHPSLFFQIVQQVGFVNGRVSEILSNRAERIFFVQTPQQQ